MIVLGLDTTGANCSVCVTRGGQVVAQMSERLGRGHAERLAPMVVETLAAAKLKPADIQRLAVITGPGSFTGLRVALSFAKGFALPRRLPIIGIDRLALALSGAPDGFALIDIRRGQSAVATHGEKPAVLSSDEAEARAESHAGPVLRDPDVALDVACRLAGEVTPSDYPPAPFYGRAPDAKLPGGITPPHLK